MATQAVPTSPQYTIKDKYGTITVYTRNHIGDCTLTDPNQNNCSCPKWIYANRKDHKPKRYAAETPSFSQAGDIAKHTHDGWHPEIAAARADNAKRERSKKRICDVVTEFIAEKSIDAAHSTISGMRSTLGYVDENGKVGGHLSLWLDEVNRTRGKDRIEYMDQLDHDLLREFKIWSKRRLKTDLSRKVQWGQVRRFFHWAHENDKSATNPAQKHKAPKADKGNRCGAFSDQQFEDILAAIPVYARKKFRHNSMKESDPFRKVLEQRLTIFVLLMRYAGMAILDAILFRPFTDTSLGLKGDVLFYRRHKTDELAVVLIENQRLLDLIYGGIPLPTEFHNSKTEAYDPRRPFSPRGFDPAGDVKEVTRVRQLWSTQLEQLFKIAGITKIETELGWRNPHSHMFRDTFARFHLKRGEDIRHLAKMLGHSSIQTTEAHYSSWMDQDRLAMIDAVRARSAAASKLIAMPSRISA